MNVSTELMHIVEQAVGLPPTLIGTRLRCETVLSPWRDGGRHRALPLSTRSARTPREAAS